MLILVWRTLRATFLRRPYAHSVVTMGHDHQPCLKVHISRGDSSSSYGEAIYITSEITVTICQDFPYSASKSITDMKRFVTPIYSECFQIKLQID